MGGSSRAWWSCYSWRCQLRVQLFSHQHYIAPSEQKGPQLFPLTACWITSHQRKASAKQSSAVHSMLLPHFSAGMCAPHCSAGTQCPGRGHGKPGTLQTRSWAARASPQQRTEPCVPTFSSCLGSKDRLFNRASPSSDGNAALLSAVLMATPGTGQPNLLPHFHGSGKAALIRNTSTWRWISKFFCK